LLLVALITAILDYGLDLIQGPELLAAQALIPETAHNGRATSNASRKQWNLAALQSCLVPETSVASKGGALNLNNDKPFHCQKIQAIGLDYKA
jgi:hypothetical protein